MNIQWGCPPNVVKLLHVWLLEADLSFRHYFAENLDDIQAYHLKKNFFFSFFFDVDHFKTLYWTCYNTASVLCFGFWPRGMWNLRASLVAQMVKNLPTVQETWVPSLGWGDPLGEGMATHCSILAWRIPWTEEPGGLQSMGSQRVRHDWATLTHTHTHTILALWPGIEPVPPALEVQGPNPRTVTQSP